MGCESVSRNLSSRRSDRTWKSCFGVPLAATRRFTKPRNSCANGATDASGPLEMTVLVDSPSSFSLIPCAMQCFAPIVSTQSCRPRFVRKALRVAFGVPDSASVVSELVNAAPRKAACFSMSPKRRRLRGKSSSLGLLVSSVKSAGNLRFRVRTCH
jgi:hypothetical protein